MQTNAAWCCCLQDSQVWVTSGLVGMLCRREASHGSLMPGRYALLVLSLVLPPYFASMAARSGSPALTRMHSQGGYLQHLHNP